MAPAIESSASLLDILDAAIQTTGAAKGTVQQLNSQLDALEIIAQRGFDESFLKVFSVVRADNPCVCGRALRFKRRVVVSDVYNDIFFWPYLSVARAAGFRSVQSTPIFGEDNSIKGIFSIHFAQPHPPTNQTAEMLDRCAAQMAKAMDENF